MHSSDAALDEIDDIINLEAGFGVLSAQRAIAIDHAREVSESVSDQSTAEKRKLARRVFVTEVACALHMAERTVLNLVEESRLLVHTLPATLASLGEGRISYRHARILVDQCAGLSAENRAELEAQMLPVAEGTTPGQFERRVRKAREVLDEESIKERHERSQADRAVFFEPAQDGMCWVTLYLAAAEGAAMYNRVVTQAMSLQTAEEPRTLPQLQADVFRDLILDAGPGAGPAGASAMGSRGIKPDICLTVPVLSLLGRSDEPATLEGYGPIDIDTAKQLVGKAKSFVRILTHPETGAILSVGHKRYKAPADLQTVLRLRDVTCRFPGCNRLAIHCDLDHTDDWQFGGLTKYDNLEHLCPKHHAMKHEGGWKVVQSTDGDGTLTWTSPAGRTYTTEPETRIGPAPVGSGPPSLPEPPAPAPTLARDATPPGDVSPAGDPPPQVGPDPSDDPPPF